MANNLLSPKIANCHFLCTNMNWFFYDIPCFIQFHFHRKFFTYKDSVIIATTKTQDQKPWDKLLKHYPCSLHTFNSMFTWFYNWQFSCLVKYLKINNITCLINHTITIKIINIIQNNSVKLIRTQFIHNALFTLMQQMVPFLFFTYQLIKNTSPFFSHKFSWHFIKK